MLLTANLVSESVEVLQGNSNLVRGVLGLDVQRSLAARVKVIGCVKQVLVTVPIAVHGEV